jgi:hypothetical protein
MVGLVATFGMGGGCIGADGRAIVCCPDCDCIGRATTACGIDPNGLWALLFWVAGAGLEAEGATGLSIGTGADGAGGCGAIGTLEEACSRMAQGSSFFRTGFPTGLVLAEGFGGGGASEVKSFVEARIAAANTASSASCRNDSTTEGGKTDLVVEVVAVVGTISC